MEYFDICDADGIPTGETVSRPEAHRLGIRHRTSHVWVIRHRGDGGIDVLLQQRSREKDSFPGEWDTSSAGHIPAGDEPLESAARELAQELGIHADPAALRRIGDFNIQYEMTFHGACFRDNEFSNVYIYDQPVDIAALTLQRSQVSAVGWFDLQRVWQACVVREDWICVPTGGLRVLMRHLGMIG